MAVRDLRRETDELSDVGETTESSHRRTDEVECEVLEECKALSDVEESPFAQESEEFCCDTRVIGSHAGRQQGLVERHGGLLSEIWNNTVCEFQTFGREQTILAVAVRVQAKNATLTWCGVAPGQAVFGRAVRWFSPSADVDDSCVLTALGSDGSRWMSSKIRTAASIAVLERDMQKKLRAALLRRSPSVREIPYPGTQVYLQRQKETERTQNAGGDLQ